MKIGVSELTDRVQTGRAIYYCATFYNDLGSLLDLSLKDFFNTVKKMPYIEDQIDSEVVARPKYLLDQEKFPALDCKKKSVLIGAWLNAHNMPWRLVAISEKPNKNIQHVFPQALINNEWLSVDPTYPEYSLFMPKPQATAAEELPR